MFSGHRSSGNRYAIVETAELRMPFRGGWRRETLVREYSKSGIRGDVVYYAPCGKKFKQYPDIVRVRTKESRGCFETRSFDNSPSFALQYLEKNGITDLSREHFSFSTKVFIGEFLKPTGMMENGEEKYVRLTEDEMIAEVDKIRAENGWKPRKRPGEQPPQPSGRQSSKQRKLEAAAAAAMLTQNMTPEQKLLARLQAEVQLREQVLQQQNEMRMRKEALK